MHARVDGVCGNGYYFEVLTRPQLAERLGKSVATIRRIEGVLLHPHQDARGVYRFDAAEVDALANRVLCGEVSLFAGIETGNRRASEGDVRLESYIRHVRRRCAAAESRAIRLTRENAQLRAFTVCLFSILRFERRSCRH